MSQKAHNGGIAGNAKVLSPEANAYNDDVTLATVRQICAERGVDVSKPQWKTIEALGQVVRAT